MPVQETIDGVTELGSERLPVGHVILNLVRPALLSAGTVTAVDSGKLTSAKVGASLAKAALDPDAAEALIDEGAAHIERQQLQDRQRDVLHGEAERLAELPWLSDGIDLGALFELAETLKDGGVL
jgi:hypothetical protein